VVERAGKPHFSFRDLDENRPLASIRIRVETMHYFLQNYQRALQRRPHMTPVDRAGFRSVSESSVGYDPQ